MNAAVIENLTFHVLEKTGSVNGTTRSKMTAREQRALFGQYLGKGTIIIDGLSETVVHRVKVSFGQDWEDTHRISWRDL